MIYPQWAVNREILNFIKKETFFMMMIFFYLLIRQNFNKFRKIQPKVYKSVNFKERKNYE